MDKGGFYREGIVRGELWIYVKFVSQTLQIGVKSLTPLSKLVDGEGGRLKGMSKLIRLHHEMNRAVWRECGVTGDLVIDGSVKGGCDFVPQIVTCGGSSFLFDTGAERLFMQHVASSLSVCGRCNVKF